MVLLKFNIFSWWNEMAKGAKALFLPFFSASFRFLVQLNALSIFFHFINKKFKYKLSSVIDLICVFHNDMVIWKIVSWDILKKDEWVMCRHADWSNCTFNFKSDNFFFWIFEFFFIFVSNFSSCFKKINSFNFAMP